MAKLSKCKLCGAEHRLGAFCGAPDRREMRERVVVASEQAGMQIPSPVTKLPEPVTKIEDGVTKIEQPVTKIGRGRPKRYENNAARQRAYRERQ